MKAKHDLRKGIIKKLHTQSKEQRLGKSRLIAKQLFALTEFNRAKCIMCYVSTEYEVNTQDVMRSALELNKKVAVPVVLMREKRMIASVIKDMKSLSPGPLGIMQPAQGCAEELASEKIDLVLVPGIAFDRECNRLGRGAGYYDKFLATVPTATPRIGLAFDFQVVQNLPVLSHDMPVTRVISA